MGFPVPGGSVLVCYRLDDKDANGVTVPHGYIREYHLATAVINGQLAQMFAAGQRRLGLAIAYMQKPDGFALDCSGFTMAPQDRLNLVAILTRAIDLGFAEFVLEFIPEWEMSYANWQNVEIQAQFGEQPRAWQPLIYARMLAFTRDVYETAKGACAPHGVNVYADLIGECGSAALAARFWGDWCDLYPDPADLATQIGFSMVPVQSSIDAIPSFYPNGVLPRVWNVHCYNDTARQPEPEMTWPEFRDAMQAKGYSQPYINGETNCDDAQTAAMFAGSPAGLCWILQWGVVSGITPDMVTQDRLTLTYDAYHAAGL